jgi:hypothetical protein
MKKRTWYVIFEIPWRGTAVRSRRSRSTQTFETEMEAKNFARAKFDEGLVVTAGTIIPHLPRRAIASGSITAWLDEGREQDSGHGESTDPQSGRSNNPQGAPHPNDAQLALVGSPTRASVKAKSPLVRQ